MRDPEDDGYTPGTYEVRAAWCAWYDGKEANTPSWHVNEFDRWLREHDREVSELAFHEALEAVQAAINTAVPVDEETVLVIVNPYAMKEDEDD